jgi:hypothetical protein
MGLDYMMLDEFCKRRHRETQKLKGNSARVIARNERICQRARELKAWRGRRKLTSKLASEFDLTTGTVLSILKKAKIL